jgi:hypothetical protein
MFKPTAEAAQQKMIAFDMTTVGAVEEIAARAPPVPASCNPAFCPFYLA